MQYHPYTVGYFRTDLSVSDPREQRKFSMGQGNTEHVKTQESGIETGEAPGTPVVLLAETAPQSSPEQAQASNDLLELRLLVSEDRTMQSKGVSLPLHSIVWKIPRENLAIDAERLQREGQEIARQYHLLDTAIAEARHFVYAATDHGQRQRSARAAGTLKTSIPRRELIDDALKIWTTISAQSWITTHQQPSLYHNLQRLEAECAAYDATASVQKAREQSTSPQGSPKQIPSIVSYQGRIRNK